MALQHTAFWTLLIMASLVGGSTVAVVDSQVQSSPATASDPNCPAIPGWTGWVYCENVTVPATGSSQACALGPTASGVFHAVTFSFHHFISCGPLISYGVNGTIEEGAGATQPVLLSVAPPLLSVWCNYTSPDGRVLVAWEGYHLNVTLAVAA